MLVVMMELATCLAIELDLNYEDHEADDLVIPISALRSFLKYVPQGTEPVNHVIARFG